MKPQDLIFAIVLLGLILKRDIRVFAVIGLTLLLVAIPLFAKQIFFTAERFIDYSFLLFCLVAVMCLFQNRDSKYENRN